MTVTEENQKVSSGDTSGSQPKEPTYKYGFSVNAPTRTEDGSKRVLRLKKLLNKLKNNAEVETDPSCLVLDPLYYNDPHFSILFFFLEISQYDSYHELVDLSFLSSCFEKGADVKARDRLEQTILHDVARVHTATTVMFFLRSGAEVNVQDVYGRTPLHIAAKYDRDDIVTLFLKYGARTDLTTKGGCFTPLHSAAMGDAAKAIEVLINAGCNKEQTDYRGRTALLIAAEYDRRSATAKLIELGSSTKVVDYTGIHALSLIIARTPKLGLQALDQCVDRDSKSREIKVWLNYMEPDLQVPKDARYGFSLVDEVARSKDSNLVQHPAVQALISTKWKQFGQRGVIKDIGLYLIYLLSWSFLMILTPLSPPSPENPHQRGTRRLIAEIIAYIFYIVFVLEEISEFREGNIEQQKYKNMRIGQIQSDLKILRPLTDNDRFYLNSEIEKASKKSSIYFSDAWNVYDWCSYMLQFVGIIVYLYCEVVSVKIDITNKEEIKSYEKTFRVRSQLMSVAIMLSWFKLFKYVRVFKSMGPFVVIITHSIGDIGKIAFVYLVLYIPMVCIFYQFYGNRGLTGYETVQDVMFTVFRMIVVDDYNYNKILGPRNLHGAADEEDDADSPSARLKRKANYDTSDEDSDGVIESDVVVDMWWTQTLVGFWIVVSSVVLLNLFIALMSDTFQRVYDNAVGVAALETAETISGLEGKLSKKSRDKHLKDLSDNYSPMTQYLEHNYDEDDDSADMKRFDDLDHKMGVLEEQLKHMNEMVFDELHSMQNKNMTMLHDLNKKLTEFCGDV